MADARDLKSRAARRAGSSPASRKTPKKRLLVRKIGRGELSSSRVRPEPPSRTGYASLLLTVAGASSASQTAFAQGNPQRV